jgi:hypothetical protein
MIRRAKPAVRLLLAAALLYGSGAHWLLVQGAAWAGMVAARSSRNSVAEAVTTTFDGSHPCRVCLLVKRGASADATPRASRPAPAVDFAFAARPAVIAAVEASAPISDAPLKLASAPRVPPSPPPNLLRAA